MAKMIDGPTADEYDEWIDTGSGPGWARKRRPTSQDLDRWTDANRVVFGLPGEVSDPDDPAMDRPADRQR